MKSNEGTATAPVLQAQIMMALIWGILCLLSLAPPLLLAHAHAAAATAIYIPFSFICHQIPARSFFLLQFPLAVCHRCCGLYLGSFIGSLHEPPCLRLPWRKRRRLIAAAILLTALDAALPLCGLWANTWWSRWGTGMILGYVTSPLLVQGAGELRAAGLRRFAAAGRLSIKVREIIHE